MGRGGIELDEIPKGCWVCGGILLACILITSIFLIAFSFQYVEYDEYAFRKNTATSDIDTSEVFENGRYFWGVNYASFTLPRTYQTVSLTPDALGALSIFTQAGLSVLIECSFQYRLVKEQVNVTFAKYGINYNTGVVNVARSILKNIAPQFTTEDYYERREYISEVFFQALQTGLEAQAHVQVGHFQLRKVTLSPQVQTKVIQGLVQDQVNLEEAYRQNATLIRKQTTTLQEETFANITRIGAEALANSSLIEQQAQTSAFQIRLQSKQAALNNLFTALNFTTTEQKLAFLYATGLGDRAKISGLTTKAIADLSSLLVTPSG